MGKCSFQVFHWGSHKPDVTVVVPVRKGGDPSLTLKTLKKQTYQAFQVLVVHDDHQMGAAYCRNRGWDQVETPMLLFSDDDISWHPQALELMVNTLQSNWQASFAWGSYFIGGKQVGVPTPGKHWDLKRLKRQNYISTMALWKPEDFPGFDEGLIRHQDWDVYLRAAKQGKWGAYAGNLFTTQTRSGDISSGSQINILTSKRHIQAKHTAPFVDVVIPCYLASRDLVELTQRCLTSLKEHTTGIRVIAIDNGSGNWHQIQDQLDDLTYLVIRNRKNLGFVKAANQGLVLSDAPFVVLLNNDTTVTPGWLPNLMAPMAQDAGIGAAGPRTDATGSWQGREKDTGQPWVVLNERQMLAFFCVLIRKKCLDKVGLLDQHFGVGFGDDDDWCYRCHQAGWQLVFVRDSFVRHHHRTTFKSLYSDAQIYQMQTRALKKLQRKHNGIWKTPGKN